jgi:glycosyltransferase involved in cell wall biosynthesis
MPKILFVIARLNTGGTSRYLAELISGLKNSEYECVIATGQVQDQETEYENIDEMPIKRIKNLGRKISILDDFLARRNLSKYIDDFDPDLIYTHTFKAGFLVRTLRLKVPVIHAYHGHLIDEPELSGFRIRIVMFFERLLARRAKYLVTVGKRVSVELLEAGVGSTHQYISIPPGIRPLELVNRSLVISKFALKDSNSPIVVWMARVVSVKAPERVISLALSFPQATFLVIGGGNLLPEITRKAPANMKILGWQNAQDIWSVADIAISTSKNEGMPISLIEAQQSGVPVVAVNVGSVAEVIEDKVTGFVVDEFDESYFDCLRTLINNRELRRRLGEIARITAIDKFSTRQLVDRHLELFQKVI